MGSPLSALLRGRGEVVAVICGGSKSKCAAVTGAPETNMVWSMYMFRLKTEHLGQNKIFPHDVLA